MTNTAVIFGTQRCGSNFFLSACQKLDGLAVLGEMYHRGGVFPFRRDKAGDTEVKRQLGEIILTRFPDHAADMFNGWTPAAERTESSESEVTKALVRFAHRAPNRYFEALQQLAAGGRLIFKIFPEHLDMIQILSILHEQRPRVLFLLRNPLDTFISYKKLVETEKPQDVDTSEIKIRFNPAEYFAYKGALATYFRTIRDFCAHESLEVTMCHYEWLHGSESDDKVEKVRDQMQRLFGGPVQLAAGQTAQGLFKRQDKSEWPAQKVLNPGALPRSPQILMAE